MISSKFFCAAIFTIFIFYPLALNAMENAAPNTCVLCCIEQENKQLECIHCKQKFCRACGERGIGISFTYTTNYNTSLNWQAKNDACPFCRKTLSRDDFDRMILASDANARLKTETQLLIEKIDRKESLSVQKGTIPSCNIPVVLIDEVKFAIIPDNIKGIDIALDFKDINLIILAEISVDKDILIKCKNAFFLSDVRGENIYLDISEKLIVFGINIHYRGKVKVPPESRQILGAVYTKQRLNLIKEFKKALEVDNLLELGNFIKLLLLYNGQPE